MKLDVTNQICSRCLELESDCVCDEEPKVKEWDDMKPNEDLLGKFQKGEETL